MLKEKNIDLHKKNVILFGNDGYACVKAVFESYGISNNRIKIYLGGYAEWMKTYVPPPTPKSEGTTIGENLKADVPVPKTVESQIEQVSKDINS